MGVSCKTQFVGSTLTAAFRNLVGLDKLENPFSIADFSNKSQMSLNY
jgi:hypothetical protein